MKLLLAGFAASLLVLTTAQFSIGSPKPGDTITPGQNITVEIIVPIDTSAEAGVVEVALTIGVLTCSSSCASPSADLGEILFLGKYQSQGAIGSSLNSFENLTLQVPTNLSGTLAAIQVQHVFLTTPPQHALPTVEYTSVQVSVSNSTGVGSNSTSTIHPNGNNSKCVGILGGVYGNGTAVDIFDCNGSNTQKWQFNGNALTSINPADQSQWCLDAGVQSQWADGVKMKIWECFSGLPQQTWTPIQTSGTIKLTSANFCLDLTNGITTNQNVLQIWTCTPGDTNQVWSITPA